MFVEFELLHKGSAIWVNSENVGAVWINHDCATVITAGGKSFAVRESAEVVVEALAGIPK